MGMGSGDPVAIIGGGITGLSAAYELHKRGVPFLLFEGSDRVGGVIRTESVDGFTIDGGPDSLLIQKPAAVELCAELGLGERLVSTLPPRTAYVLKAGSLYPLPDASVFGIPTRLGPLATTQLSATVSCRKDPNGDGTGDTSVGNRRGRIYRLVLPSTIRR